MNFSVKTLTSLLVAGWVLSGCGGNVIRHRIDPADILFRIHVIRHAEAYKNVPHLPGIPEAKLDSLTLKGRKQAAAIGRYLKGKGVVAVIASPTGRTRETAEAIDKALGMKRPYMDGKAFASLGGGKTPSGKPATWSWRVSQWQAGRDPRPEEGESLADGSDRAVSAISRLSKTYPGKAVAIVTHGDMCAAILGHADNTPMVKRYKRHEVRTGSISEIVVTQSGWRLQSQGVVPPL